MTTYTVYVDARVRACFNVEADSEEDATNAGWAYDGDAGDVLDVYEVLASDAIAQG